MSTVLNGPALESLIISAPRTRYIEGAGRLGALDAARGVAACLIVAHHLIFYGRTADLLMEIVPGLVQFLFDDARMIVQLFLVLGGFGLAWSTSRNSIACTWTWAFKKVVGRYLRLSIPYAVMLCILIGAAKFFGELRPGNPLVESISWIQLLAHAFFVQDILGFESLSAGVWYLCIDFQFAILFYLLSALIATLCNFFKWTTPQVKILAVVLCILGTCSTFYWNRNAALDYSSIYFLGPFVLGALVAWERKQLISAEITVIYCCLFALSLGVDFRERLMVALACAALLWLTVRFGSHWQMPRWVTWLGRISYSLFLIHYTVCCFLMAILDSWMGADPLRAAFVFLFAFAASIAAGAWLHHCIEQPALRWLDKGKAQPNFQLAK